MSDLKPCPFCGGEAQTYCVDTWWVSHACDCLGKYIGTKEHQTEAEAIAAWNSRAERTCKVISHRTFCGAGGCEEAGELWTLSCGHEVMNNSDCPPNFCDECGCKVVGE